MGDNSLIEWTDATWNPVVGCQKVSAGCDNCYAERVTKRTRPGIPFEHVELKPERLGQPLRWRKPRMIFVNSLSDLFHDAIPDDFIVKVFDVMASGTLECRPGHRDHDAECWGPNRHTFQILTKRPGRMASFLSPGGALDQIADEWFPGDCALNVMREVGQWPLPNVWLGVSVEDQKTADLRIPKLLHTPAAVRFLSCEPLLGPVELFGPALVAEPSITRTDYGTGIEHDVHHYPGVDWVIAGGESGPGARPMHPDWVRSLRDQCVEAGVPFFFKQRGEWSWVEPLALECSLDVPMNWRDHPDRFRFLRPDGSLGDGYGGDGGEYVVRVGKKRAGRLLDGRTWDQMPLGDEEYVD